jgi:hypothetical protein
MKLQYSDGTLDEYDVSVYGRCSLLEDVKEIFREFPIQYPYSERKLSLDSFQEIEGYWLFWSYLGNTDRLHEALARVLFTLDGLAWLNTDPEIPEEMHMLISEFEFVNTFRHWVHCETLAEYYTPSVVIRRVLPYVTEFCEWVFVNRKKYDAVPIHSFFEYFCRAKSKLSRSSVFQRFETGRAYFSGEPSSNLYLRLYRGEQLLPEDQWLLLNYNTLRYAFWGEHGGDLEYLRYVVSLLGTEKIQNALTSCRTPMQIQIMLPNNLYSEGTNLVGIPECLDYLVDNDLFDNIFFRGASFSRRIFDKITTCESGRVLLCV